MGIDRDTVAGMNIHIANGYLLYSHIIRFERFCEYMAGSTQPTAKCFCVPTKLVCSRGIFMSVNAKKISIQGYICFGEFTNKKEFEHSSLESIWCG